MSNEDDKGHGSYVMLLLYASLFIIYFYKFRINIQGIYNPEGIEL